MLAIVNEVVEVPLDEEGIIGREVSFCHIEGLNPDNVPGMLDLVGPNGQPVGQGQFGHPDLFTARETSSPAAIFTALQERASRVGDEVKLAAIGDGYTLRTSHIAATLLSAPV